MWTAKKRKAAPGFRSLAEELEMLFGREQAPEIEIKTEDYDPPPRRPDVTTRTYLIMTAGFVGILSLAAYLLGDGWTTGLDLTSPLVAVLLLTILGFSEALYRWKLWQHRRRREWRYRAAANYLHDTCRKLAQTLHGQQSDGLIHDANRVQVYLNEDRGTKELMRCAVCVVLAVDEHDTYERVATVARLFDHAVGLYLKFVLVPLAQALIKVQPKRLYDQSSLIEKYEAIYEAIEEYRRGRAARQTRPHFDGWTLEYRLPRLPDPPASEEK